MIYSDQRIRIRVIFTLLLIAALSLLSYYIYRTTVRFSESDGYMINLAGHQRYLSQRIALYALSVAANSDSSKSDSLKSELENTLKTMHKEHDYLVHSPSLGERYRSEAIKKIYYSDPYHLDSKVHEYFRNTEMLLNEKKITKDNPNLIRILADETDLVIGLNQVAEQYQRENEKSIFSFREKKELILFTTLFILACAWFLIFKPVVNEIKILRHIKRKETELAKPLHLRKNNIHQQEVDQLN